MALRGNRPGFFCRGWRRRGCGFPADAKVFSFCGAVVTGQGSRRKLPDFFAGVGRWGWVPGGCEGFFFLRRCCNGTRLPAQIAGIFLRGWPVGVWVPGGCGGFSPLLRFAGGDGRRDAPSLRRRCNGTRLPAQIAGFFAGVGGGGTKLLQGAGLRRKGADDCGFNARRRGWGFCGGGGRGIFTILLQKRRLRCFSGAAAL